MKYSNNKFLYWVQTIPTRIKNFFFCLKYPFWRSRNVWTGKFTGYSCTWYDDIAEGWKKAFGKQLSDDIKAAFKEDKKKNPKLKWKDALHWQQIKEKWGSLCLYASTTENIFNVLHYYEKISDGYCFACGKPAHYMTRGYILPLCEECFNRHNKNNKKYFQENFANPNEEWEKYQQECLIDEKNITPEKVEPLYKKRKDNK